MMLRHTRRSNRVRPSAWIVATTAALVAVALGSTSGRALAGPHGLPTLAGSWQALPTAPIVPSDPRLVSVWTGTEMIVWGGINLGVGLIQTGGRYDPSTDSWSATSTAWRAPSSRPMAAAIKR